MRGGRGRQERGRERGSQKKDRERDSRDGGGKDPSTSDKGGTVAAPPAAAAAAAAKPAVAQKPKANVLVDQPATVTGRTGGVYIPPFKLAQMQKEAESLGKATKEYQRIAWEALRKSINGLINKVG